MNPDSLQSAIEVFGVAVFFVFVFETWFVMTMAALTVIRRTAGIGRDADR